MEKIEDFAKVEKLKVKSKKDWGVELGGQSSNLVFGVDVYRLTEKLVVVEAKKRRRHRLLQRYMEEQA
nr:cbl-interacting serine/threonine-protein kinase 14 [Quercus suber]